MLQVPVKFICRTKNQRKGHFIWNVQSQHLTWSQYNCLMLWTNKIIKIWSGVFYFTLKAIQCSMSDDDICVSYLNNISDNKITMFQCCKDESLLLLSGHHPRPPTPDCNQTTHKQSNVIFEHKCCFQWIVLILKPADATVRPLSFRIKILLKFKLG